MNIEKRENNEESTSSDIDGGGDSGAEESMNIAATIPKKRGRPAKTNKVEKKPSGRGRGRPSKHAIGGIDIGSGGGGGGDDSITAMENGAKRTGAAGVGGGSGRGRPPKSGKLAITATGKGRGRPKNSTKRSEDGDDGDEHVERAPKKAPKSGAKRPGRPRKAAARSDDDDDISDEDKITDEERHPVGRPNTGAVNLNIIRTGRGQGRPKKSAADAAIKRSIESGDAVPKKRGRPALKNSDGVGRRPKINRASSPEDDDDDSKDDDENEDESKGSFNSPLKADDSVDEDNDDEFCNMDKKHRDISADELAAA